MIVARAELVEFLDSPDFDAVVGPNAAAFRKMWTRALNKGRDAELVPAQIGTIWWMLLVGPFWLAYRRLYRSFTIWLGIFVASCLLDIVVPQVSVARINNMAMMGVNVAFMYMGGRLYLERCLEVYRRGKSLDDPAERAALWRQEGGVNWSAVLLSLLAVGAIVLGMGMLMPGDMLY